MMPILRPPETVLTEETRLWLANQINATATLVARAKETNSRWNYIHNSHYSRHKINVLTQLKLTTANHCAYCERAVVTETIDHVRPKAEFPHEMFVWANMTLSCFDCNVGKLAKYGVTADGTPNIIDPTAEDPTQLFGWDLGTLASAEVVTGQASVRAVEASDRITATVEAFDLDNQSHCSARLRHARSFLCHLMLVGDEDFPEIRRPPVEQILRDTLALQHPYRSVFRQLVTVPAFEPLIAAAVRLMPDLEPLIAGLSRPLHHPDHPPPTL